MNQEKPESTQPEFWSQRYASGRTPWRLDHVPAQLKRFIESLAARSRVLIPGCGEDNQTVDAFFRAGHKVTAIDFSPIAVSRLRKSLPALREEIILGDFFHHTFESDPFDVVYERTFLCSLPPRMWKSYAKRVAQLLRPEGMLAGFFFYGEETDPPPFPLDDSTADKVFGEFFVMRTSEPVPDSLPVFGGREKWQEWQLPS
ncbi:MAG TPA: methyltransferase domain-containing protein [Chthoniobacterales bacterium]|nr:methyltransferase domain-containing protein [Chthoniobacterales bacterium]